VKNTVVLGSTVTVHCNIASNKFQRQLNLTTIWLYLGFGPLNVVSYYDYRVFTKHILAGNARFGVEIVPISQEMWPGSWQKKAKKEGKKNYI